MNVLMRFNFVFPETQIVPSQRSPGSGRTSATYLLLWLHIPLYGPGTPAHVGLPGPPTPTASHSALMAIEAHHALIAMSPFSNRSTSCVDSSDSV